MNYLYSPFIYLLAFKKKSHFSIINGDSMREFFFFLHLITFSYNIVNDPYWDLNPRPIHSLCPIFFFEILSVLPYEICIMDIRQEI